MSIIPIISNPEGYLRKKNSESWYKSAIPLLVATLTLLAPSLILHVFVEEDGGGFREHLTSVLVVVGMLLANLLLVAMILGFLARALGGLPKRFLALYRLLVVSVGVFIVVNILNFSLFLAISLTIWPGAMEQAMSLLLGLAPSLILLFVYTSTSIAVAYEVRKRKATAILIAVIASGLVIAWILH